MARSLCLFAGLATLLASAARGESWQIQTVDGNGDVGGHTSLALDSSGNPHISYMDWTNFNLKYAAWNGSYWTIQTVGAENAGGYTSLALDSSGHPHISYVGNGVKYAAWNGFSWDVQVVDDNDFVGSWTSLGLDSSGHPHISYAAMPAVIYTPENPPPHSLRYAAWDGSSWGIETVDSNGDVGECTSLALDNSGNPHISYLDWTNFDLKYATWDGESWAIQSVDTPGKVGAWTSLALDSAGNPHISYQGWGATFVVKYAAWTGSSWGIEIVDSNGVGWHPSLALDGSGSPRISYGDITNGDLKYAAWNGSSWTIQIVDSTGSVGQYTSLALDSCGNPHISYYDVTNGDLKYAYLPEPASAALLLTGALTLLRARCRPRVAASRGRGFMS